MIESNTPDELAPAELWISRDFHNQDRGDLLGVFGTNLSSQEETFVSEVLGTPVRGYYLRDQPLDPGEVCYPRDPGFPLVKSSLKIDARWTVREVGFLVHQVHHLPQDILPFLATHGDLDYQDEDTLLDASLDILQAHVARARGPIRITRKDRDLVATELKRAYRALCLAVYTRKRTVSAMSFDTSRSTLLLVDHVSVSFGDELYDRSSRLRESAY